MFRFGLEIAASKVWTVKVMAWYGLQKLKGKKLHTVDGDPNQLGGSANLIEWQFSFSLTSLLKGTF